MRASSRGLYLLPSPPALLRDTTWPCQDHPGQNWVPGKTLRSLSRRDGRGNCGLLCQRKATIALISHASKVMLKILQARLQQYVNRELPDVQAGFRKGRGTRDQIANIHWIMEKGREFQKNIYFCFIDYAKAFDCVITINCGKF